MQPQITYIFGRGHSGSTVLDSIISNADCTTGVGELIVGLGRDQSICGCGLPVDDCGYWNEVASVFKKESDMSLADAGERIRMASVVTQFFRRLFESRSRAEVIQNRKINQAVITAIAKVSGSSTVVDSSKEISRAMMIARQMPDARLIHLVRKPDAVIASNLLRIRDGRGFSFMRRRFKNQRFTVIYVIAGSIGWMVGNVLAELVGYVAKERVLRVRYEDLCSDTTGTLERIGEHLNINVGPLVEKISNHQPLAVGHTLGGNQMRHSQNFVFDTSRLKSRDIPGVYRFVVNLLTFPLQVKYQYL